MTVPVQHVGPSHPRPAAAIPHRVPFSDPDLSFSERTILRLFSGAKDAWLATADDAQGNRLITLTKALCDKQRIPRPRTIIYESDIPNAASLTGPGSIAFSTGLLKRLDDAELSYVIGHELTHHVHRNRDILQHWAMAGAVVLAFEGYSHLIRPRLDKRMPHLFSQIGLEIAEVGALVLGESAAQSAAQRVREYEADKGAITLTHNPQAGATALAKLSNSYAEKREKDEARWQEQYANMPALQKWIAGPLHAIERDVIAPVLKQLLRPFHAHPSTKNRIEAMGAKPVIINQPPAPHIAAFTPRTAEHPTSFVERTQPKPCNECQNSHGTR